MTLEERANKIGELANECCGRSDGYEEGVFAEALAQLRAASSELRDALSGAEACLDALDPREPSGLSNAETASLFNATRERIRVVLNLYR